jgi:hypothetical protein
MSIRIPGLLTSALLVTPLAAHAQTLDFYDSISGASTTLLNGTLGPPGSLSLESVPFSGSVTGSITLGGSTGGAYSFTLNENGDGGSGPGIQAINGFTLSGTLSPCGSNSYCDASDASIQILTNAKGAITGAAATVNDSETSYNSWGTDFMIAPTGVQVSMQGIIPGTNWGCAAADLTFSPTYPNGIYTGPTIKNCTVSVNSTQPGQWSVAPELDPTSAASALTLLLGGVVVLRAGRRVAKRSWLSFQFRRPQSGSPEPRARASTWIESYRQAVTPAKNSLAIGQPNYSSPVIVSISAPGRAMTA